MRTTEQLCRAADHGVLAQPFLPISIWTVDANGVLTSCQGSLFEPTAERTGGRVGESIFAMRDAPSAVLDATHRVLRGQPVTLTIGLDGVVLDGWYAPLLNPDGTADGAIGVAVEATRRHQIEAQLRGAQQLEAFGRLAASVAHDINSLLTAVLAYSELALNALDQTHPARTNVAGIAGVVASAGALTRQLLSFGRSPAPQPHVIDLDSLVERMSALLQHVIGDNIRLTISCAPVPALIFADPHQIEQVIMNFTINAREAMPCGGGLTIEVRDASAEEVRAAGRPGSAGRPHVALAVSDTGQGMHEDVQERIFEPFFTTKACGSGRGLGLATVYRIVTQGQGSLRVESEPGRGTTFTVLLPSAPCGLAVATPHEET